MDFSRGREVFGDGQRECILAGWEVVFPADGTAQFVEFEANEPGWLDLNRLIIHAGATPTANIEVLESFDMTRFVEVSSITYVGATELVRGTPAAGVDLAVPASLWSAYRRMTTIPLGPVRLSSGDNIRINFSSEIEDSAAAALIGRLYVCAPWVPDRIRGDQPWQYTEDVGGYNDPMDGPLEVLAGSTGDFLAAGGTIDAVYPSSGYADLGNMALRWHRDGAAAAHSVDQTVIGSVTGIDIPGGGEELILGDLSNNAPVGAVRAVPMAAWQAWGRQRQWFRLGMWPGNRTQSVTVTYGALTAGVDGPGTLAFPFMSKGYAGPGGRRSKGGDC